MAKAAVFRYIDVDPGVDDNNVVLLAEVAFVGATVPNGPLLDLGALGNGVPIPWNIAGTAAAFSNNVETALIARAAVLGFVLTASDCVFPSYARGT